MIESLRALPRLLLLLVLALTFAAYGPYLDGPFLFDDRQNILENPLIQAEEITLQSLQTAARAFDSTIGRPVSTISFALNHYVHGLNPFGYKLVNLWLHLATGAALYGFIAQLAKAVRLRNPAALSHAQGSWLALAVATLWLVHPLHVSTVLYTVQRMAILATLFTVLGLWAYTCARLAHLRGEWGGVPLLLAVAVCFPLALLSKENGILLVPLCGLLEFFFFRLQAAHRAIRWALAVAWTSAAVFAMLFITLGFGWLTSSYSTREFTLEERLLTQTRVIWFYLKLLLVPRLPEMALYHDDFSLSTGWLSPWTTSTSFIGIMGLLLLVLSERAQQWLLVRFSIGFFLVAHLLESTFIPLEIIFEHRNYTPAIGTALLVAACGLKVSKSHVYFRALLGAATLAVALLLYLTHERARLFSDTFELAKYSLQHHPESLRTQLWAGDIYRSLHNAAPNEKKDQLIQLAIPHYRKAAEMDPVDVIGLLQLLEFDAQMGKPINAVDYADLAQRLHTQPIRPGTVLATHEFMIGAADGRIPFPMDSALVLAEFLLDNPRCTGRFRAHTLGAAAVLDLQLREFDRAIQRAREILAIEKAGTSIKLTAAAVLYKSGALLEAEVATKKLLQSDQGGAFTPGLLDLLGDIQAALGSEVDASF